MSLIDIFFSCFINSITAVTTLLPQAMQTRNTMKYNDNNTQEEEEKEEEEEEEEEEEDAGLRNFLSFVYLFSCLLTCHPLVCYSSGVRDNW